MTHFNFPEGIEHPKPISQKQFRWLHATHAFNAGAEFIEKRGDYLALQRWYLDHDLTETAAEAAAQDCAMHWYERQLALRDA